MFTMFTIVISYDTCRHLMQSDFSRKGSKFQRTSTSSIPFDQIILPFYPDVPFLSQISETFQLSLDPHPFQIESNDTTIRASHDAKKKKRRLARFSFHCFERFEELFLEEVKEIRSRSLQLVVARTSSVSCPSLENTVARERDRCVRSNGSFKANTRANGSSFYRSPSSLGGDVSYFRFARDPHPQTRLANGYF